MGIFGALFNNGRQEPVGCDCGGDLTKIDEDAWECKECGRIWNIDSDGDIVSDAPYDPEDDY